MGDREQQNAEERPDEAADSLQPGPAEHAPEEAVDTTVRWRRERVIPLRRAGVGPPFADDPQLMAEGRARFLDFCRLLAALFHHEYHTRLEELKDLYAPFNPDNVTTQLRVCTAAAREALVPELFERFAALLERANYQRLSRREIEAAMQAASEWGLRLHVDFDTFRRLDVYARGDVVERRQRRSWRWGRRTVEIAVPLYQRLVVMLRLRDDNPRAPEADGNAVYLKLFKNIPKQDLEMLLPGTRFRLTLLDQGKILLPTVSGLGLAAFKIVRGALWVAVAGAYGGAMAVLGLVGGTVGYGVRSFFGYLRTKERYQLQVTSSLYYQNLDNNEGVLYRLLDEGEEQDFLETVLAYTVLLRRGAPAGWSLKRLDREVETFLTELVGFAVDFEVRDALAKLTRLGCATQAGDGRWHAVPLSEAVARLDRSWDGAFTAAPASPPTDGSAP
jgi:hypothetical protein